MNRKGTLVAALLILVLLATACGAEPTATPAPTNTPLPPTNTSVPPTDTVVPPTDTPVPTDTPLPTSTPAPTPTPIPVPEMVDEAFRNKVAGYAILYPQGWQQSYDREMEGDVFYGSQEPIEDVLHGDAVPAVPLVLILSGPLDTILSGAMEDVQDAKEMLLVFTASLGDVGSTELGEVQAITVGGETAATMEALWSQDGVPIAGRFVTIHLGDRGFVILSAGQAEGWSPFAPTFEAMLESMEIFEPAIGQALVTQEYEGKYYSILYPEGWLTYSEGDMTAFLDSESTMQEEVPSVPVVLIESGPLDTLSEGRVAEASNAEEMLQALAAAQSEQGKEFEIGELDRLSIAGEQAAMMDIRWFEGETAVLNLAVAIHKGDWGIIIQAVGMMDSWHAFAETYGEMLDSLILMDKEAPGEVDLTDPASVVEAVFTAAQTEDFSVLSSLCDPRGDNDGDTQMICDITDDHEDRDLFVEYFAPGKIYGEVVIDGDMAQVPFLFGPDGDQEEAMILILRDGKWYLYSF